jgi:5-methylcytosine-specific restriction endonuclease McrA
MGGKALRHTVECVCLQCGKRFTRKPSDIKNGGGKYCGCECLYEARRNRAEYTCKYCGKVFIGKVSAEKWGHGKYCSSQCYNATRPSIEKPCEYCGLSFKAQPSQLKRGNDKYCSPKCRSTAMGINRTGDKHPLWLGGHGNFRGHNWREQRKLALDRDGETCQICHRKRRKGERQFPVHHIRAYREFATWQEANELSNLITLCHSCHPKAEHGKLAVPVRLF